MQPHIRSPPHSTSYVKRSVPKERPFNNLHFHLLLVGTLNQETKKEEAGTIHTYTYIIYESQHHSCCVHFAHKLQSSFCHLVQQTYTTFIPSIFLAYNSIFGFVLLLARGQKQDIVESTRHSSFFFLLSYPPYTQKRPKDTR